MIAPEVFTFPDATRLARAAAETVVGTLRSVLDARDRASLVLTGGSTPRSLYDRLATDYGHALDWQRVDIFFSDERHVPHNDEDSNYRMARETLLDGLGIPPEHVYPFPTNGTPEADARAYEETLRDYFDGEPTFDLMLLGMGGDGHVASLFPGIAALDDTERWVLATESPPSSPVRDRLTLTFPVLDAARTTLFLVTGERKSEALRDVLENPDRSPPAEGVTATERLLWYVDDAAMSGLNRDDDLA